MYDYVKLHQITLTYTDALIVAEVINSQNKEQIEIKWSDDWKGDGNVRLTDSQNKVLAERSSDVSRYFARTTHTDLYGKY